MEPGWSLGKYFCVILNISVQPYDLNLYTAFNGAGVTRDRSRYSQGLFYAMYYGSGQWTRREAGTEAR